MGIDMTLREISERLAAVNADATIQLHQRVQQNQLILEDSYKEIKALKKLHIEQIVVCERIEGENQTIRQEAKGQSKIEYHFYTITHVLI